MWWWWWSVGTLGKRHAVVVNFTIPGRRVPTTYMYNIIYIIFGLDGQRLSSERRRFSQSSDVSTTATRDPPHTIKYYRRTNDRTNATTIIIHDHNDGDNDCNYVRAARYIIRIPNCLFKRNFDATTSTAIDSTDRWQKMTENIDGLL